MVHEVNRPPVITTSSTSSINVSSSVCTDALSNIPDKNAAGEVGVPDTNLVSLLRPVLDGAPIILIGYRGAEPSIMEGIFAQNKERVARFSSRHTYKGAYVMAKRCVLVPSRSHGGSAQLSVC